MIVISERWEICKTHSIIAAACYLERGMGPGTWKRKGHGREKESPSSEFSGTDTRDGENAPEMPFQDSGESTGECNCVGKLLRLGKEHQKGLERTVYRAQYGSGIVPVPIILAGKSHDLQHIRQSTRKDFVQGLRLISSRQNTASVHRENFKGNGIAVSV